MNEEKCPCDAVRELQKIVTSHEHRLADGNTNFAVISTTLDAIQTSIAEIKTDLKQLKEKPQRRADAIVNTVINAGIAIVLAFLAAKIGLA